MDYRSVNKVILLGNIGKDAEMNYTQNKFPICTFSLATTERVRNDKTNESSDRTEWHRCVLAGKMAENLMPFLKKGIKLYVEGKLHTREWQDREGKKRYSTEIRIMNVQILTSKGESSSNIYQDYEQLASSSNKKQESQTVPDETNDYSDYTSSDDSKEGFSDIPDVPGNADDDLPF